MDAEFSAFVIYPNGPEAFVRAAHKLFGGRIDTSSDLATSLWVREGDELQELCAMDWSEEPEPAGSDILVDLPDRSWFDKLKQMNMPMVLVRHVDVERPIERFDP